MGEGSWKGYMRRVSGCNGEGKEGGDEMGSGYWYGDGSDGCRAGNGLNAWRRLDLGDGRRLRWVRTDRRCSAKVAIKGQQRH